MDSSKELPGIVGKTDDTEIKVSDSKPPPECNDNSLIFKARTIEQKAKELISAWERETIQPSISRTGTTLNPIPRSSWEYDDNSGDWMLFGVKSDGEICSDEDFSPYVLRSYAYKAQFHAMVAQRFFHFNGTNNPSAIAHLTLARELIKFAEGTRVNAKEILNLKKIIKNIQELTETANKSDFILIPDEKEPQKQAYLEALRELEAEKQPIENAKNNIDKPVSDPLAENPKQQTKALGKMSLERIELLKKFIAFLEPIAKKANPDFDKDCIDCTPNSLTKALNDWEVKTKKQGAKRYWKLNSMDMDLWKSEKRKAICGVTQGGNQEIKKDFFNNLNLHDYYYKTISCPRFQAGEYHRLPILPPDEILKN